MPPLIFALTDEAVIQIVNLIISCVVTCVTTYIGYLVLAVRLKQNQVSDKLTDVQLTANQIHREGNGHVAVAQKLSAELLEKSVRLAQNDMQVERDAGDVVLQKRIEELERQVERLQGSSPE